MHRGAQWLGNTVVEEPYSILSRSDHSTSLGIDALI